MTEIRQIDFPEKDLPLRADVSLMGQLLGSALVEQHGPELLAQAEAIRTAAIAWRESSTAEPADLEALLATLDMESVQRIVKAFSTYLRLANLAEKTHRIRRRREYQKNDAGAQAGSLEAVFTELAAQGCGRRRPGGANRHAENPPGLYRPPHRGHPAQLPGKGIFHHPPPHRTRHRGPDAAGEPAGTGPHSRRH